MQVSKRIGSRAFVLAMSLVGVLTLAGCGGSGSSGEGTNATATPTFTPGAGTYNASQTVTIADSTTGAVLYCTTDGTTPTSSSPQCSQPTTVFKSEFLQAIAVAPGKAPSAVASAGYTINLNAAATPRFSPAGGSYTSAQTVSISDTSTGANVYYTTDGSVPTVNSTLYTGPIALSKSATLSAIAVASGLANSGVASATYVIGQGTATPLISPAGGAFAATQSVSITDATAGASIYYTTDGSIPTVSSNLYSAPISVSSTQTINAVAIASGVSSSVATAAFTINIPAAATPTFNPAAGTYSSTQTVLLSDSTPGATIYYTIDGSAPTVSSAQYNGAGINVSSSQTVKAIATAPGFGPSAVGSAAYTINASVATPTFSPAAGTFTSAQTVTISDATSGAKIYYTLDGSTPTTSSTPYSAPIPVSATATITAIAAVGSTVSSPATAAYTINLGPQFSGTVFSGTLPVNGASVQMYAAGETGYNSAATPLLTTPAMSGADGKVSFSYNCPAVPGDLVYLVATGGNTGSGGGSNSALSFMAALGSCNAGLPSTVVINEATTVASTYALAQFMSGAANVGSASSSASIQGLTNAFKTVGNLVDVTTGQVRDHTPDYPTNLAGDPNILNNSTVPQARVNTLANVLNVCAATGSGCSSLFSAATPSSGTAPADTLQAMLNIAQNPGNNASEIFNVAPTGPFTPVLAAAPNDWTLALTFTGGGLGFAPSVPVSSVGTPAFSDGVFLNTSMAIDATGNIWVTGFNDSRSSNTSTVQADLSSGMIAQFNNQGKALTQASTFAMGVAKYGGFIPLKQADGNGGTQVPHGIAIDTSGNAWVVGGTGAISSASPAGTLAEISASPTLSLVLPKVTIGLQIASPLAIDGGGNIWTFGDDSSNNPILEEFLPDGTLHLSSNGKSSANAYGYNSIESLTFDSTGTSLWGSDAVYLGLWQMSPTDGTTTHSYYPGFNGVYTPLVAGSTAPDGSTGNVYGCGDSGPTPGTPGQTLDVYNGTSMSIVHQIPLPTTRGCGNQMVIDGAGHIFAVSGGQIPGIVDEFGVDGTVISPMTGYTGTSSGESPTINPDPNPPAIMTAPTPALAGVAGAGIDGSGNLWVLNIDSGSTSSPGNALVEFIGIAAPIVTPNSLALNFGQVGMRP